MTEVKKSKFKTWHKVALGVLALAVLGNLVKDKEQKEVATQQKVTTAASAPVLETNPEDEANWVYSEDVDKMTSERMYFASSQSTNKVDFEFPYNGGSRLLIWVRKKEKNNEIYLQISKGQFMSGFGNRYVKFKFDDNPPFNVSYSSTSDGSSDYIFMGSVSKLLSNLKKSKKMMIEAEFFDAGNRVFEFDIQNLEWNH